MSFDIVDQILSWNVVSGAQQLRRAPQEGSCRGNFFSLRRRDGGLNEASKSEIETAGMRYDPELAG